VKSRGFSGLWSYSDVETALTGIKRALNQALGVRPDRAVQVRWEDLVRRYPDLDRELDVLWRYGG
jgi:hypothetical protein